MKHSLIAALGRKVVLSLAALAMLLSVAACKRDAQDAQAPPAAMVEAKATAEPRVLYYYDPMRPEVKFDKPGPSPFMDMALVPKFAEANESTGIAVSPSIVQSLGIRVGKPVLRTVRPSVRVPARVVSDARGQARLQSRVNGWVERLAVRAVGQSVSAGTVIAEIYSPELVQAQEELLLGSDMAAAASERLRRFGIADSDIQAIRRAGKSSRRLPVRAPVSGVITEIGVREGSSVTPDTLIADFSSRFIGPGEPWEKAVAVAESIVFLLNVNLERMGTPAPLAQLVVSGGLSAYAGLCQRLADLSALRVHRPIEREATARGIAYLLAEAPGGWPVLVDADCFEPKANPALTACYARWQAALAHAIHE